ncbi:hypothetical protein VTP01DRAFT_10059 [Rhizomucor pusillus]|uniref:uncharacterized protein n=1 Tax=Rhizomucor pusillus TaxID=4840 RepID=UPI0037441325
MEQQSALLAGTSAAREWGFLSRSKLIYTSKDTSGNGDNAKMPTYLATIRYSLELRDGSLIETSDNNTFVNPHIISCDPEDRYDFSSQTENPVHRYGGHHHRARLFPNTEDSHRCAGIPRSQCTMYADCGNIHVKFCLL